MQNIVLFQPQIPPNTGNIIRLCANTGAKLHLIKPLGFTPTDSKLKRAGLDYHDWAQVAIYDNLDQFYRQVAPPTTWVCETSGSVCYTDVSYGLDDAIIFGPETCGLSDDFCQSFPQDQRIRIPICTNGRSLNLSNSVAIVIYEAWRQLDFVGC